MPLLADSLSVWDISFRLSGRDPRKLWIRIPLEVEDHLRNFMDAILKGELGCANITLEKRNFEPDEKEFSVYYWIDDIYACIHGRHFNRKLLRWAHVERFDLKLWCERMNAPLPEFWFPPGWNLEYELPEGHLTPGHEYIRREWSKENWIEWQQDQEAIKSKAASNPALNHPLETSSQPTGKTAAEDATDKMRPNQEARLACQQIAKAIWLDEPERTIASVVKDDLIQKYGGGSFYVEETIREWVKVVAPASVRNRRGAPRKNRDEAK